MTQVTPSKESPSPWVLLFSDFLISLFDRYGGWPCSQTLLWAPAEMGLAPHSTLTVLRHLGKVTSYGSCHSQSRQGCGIGRGSLTASHPSSCLKAEPTVSTYLSLPGVVLKDAEFPRQFLLLGLACPCHKSPFPPFLPPFFYLS